MQAVSFDKTIELIIKKDPRYDREAYAFVREALDFTQKGVSRTSRGEPHHISGKELLDGIRRYGIEQFGPMTLTVLNDWGVQQCEDFGEIVFNMVDYNLLAKTPTDSTADFKGGYDFDTAFKAPFLPSKSTLASKPKSTQLG